MMSANGLRIIGDVCLSEARPKIFCNLSATAAKDLSAIAIALHYPRHAVTYFEGQAYCVCRSREVECKFLGWRWDWEPHTYCRAPNPVPVDETAEPETVGTFDDYLRADSFDSLRGAFFCKTATR